MPEVTTEHLKIHYVEYGEPTAHPVLLIHGWPDDASTWQDVAQALADAGLRVIVPTLRGFGETRFVGDAPRTGNSAILAMDMVALMDGLGIDRFMVAGHDWAPTPPKPLR